MGHSRLSGCQGTVFLPTAWSLAAFVQQGRHGNAPRTRGSNHRHSPSHRPGGCKATVSVSAGLAPSLGCEGMIRSGTLSVGCG